jgi:RND family efflux transporter MFP subunit
MKQMESNQYQSDEQLLQEIAELRRQLERRHPAPHKPTTRLLITIGVLIVVGTVVAFFGGYLPRARRQAILAAEAEGRIEEIPRVSVAAVTRAAGNSTLVLTGNIQASTEAPVLARADGYVKRRYVDIGDRVTAGQVLAEIDAPELDQQLRQAEASLEQSKAALEQSLANLEQGKTNRELARVTAVRWSNLATKGVVSRQENDQYQAQYQSQTANVSSLEKAVSAQKSNIAAAEANVSRLTDVRGYLKVKAPFAGVVTLRNVDVGTLISTGNTLLFRIAQTAVLRTYINLPQAYAAAVHVGQPAKLTIPGLPGRQFAGTVARTSNALDPASRTLLTEVQVPNPDGALMPGMYAMVDLNTPRIDPPLLIPGDALVTRADGPQVAVVGPDGIVHFRKLGLGRDYGDRIEVVSGLQEGQTVAINPSDVIREGAKVKAIPLSEKPKS